MNAICSPAAGVVVWHEPDSPPVVRHLVANAPQTPAEERHVLSAIFDWEVVEGVDERSIAAKCLAKYWLCRTTSLAQCLLEGLDQTLESEVLQHLEEVFQGRVDVDAVLGDLACAPLRQPERAARLAETALSQAFAVTGGLFDRLADVQPLLRRLSDTWLDLPVSMFLPLDEDRQALWRRAAGEGVLLKAMTSPTYESFISTWNTLAFSDSEKSAASKSALAKIGTLLGERLHSRQTAELGGTENWEEQQSEHEAELNRDRRRSRRADPYPRAIRQIYAVARAVKEGNDRKARKFLDELINEQLRFGDQEFAVKSLCNIAQKCADMFRADFEQECLDRALSIDANDAWALVQYGDHLKRLGRYSEAIAELEKAATAGHRDVASSSIADVWVCQRDYARAREAYTRIPNWEMNPTVRTGLADILRRESDFDAAEREYDRILVEWPDTHRATAGKASIAKARGRFEECLSLYDSAIAQCGDDRSRLIYRHAKCAVLKLANRLDEAFQLADTIVREAPFSMSARVLRGSILGLRGQEAKGLRDMPRIRTVQSFEGWVAHYVQALLLLKLKQYRPARKQLVDRLSLAISQCDNQLVVRMGAAVTHLLEGEVEPAETALVDMGDSGDLYSQYVCSVLRLHIAVAKSDKAMVESIARTLESPSRTDPMIARAVDALKRGDVERALQCELDLLLRIAA